MHRTPPPSRRCAARTHTPNWRAGWRAIGGRTMVIARTDPSWSRWAQAHHPCLHEITDPLQIFRRPDHRAPHMRDGAVVKAQPLLRLAKIAADDIGEFFQLDDRVGIEGVDVV